MTEFWKSNPNYFCEYCKVWVKDQTQARLIHEGGTKHKENVARKLSEMRRNADKEKWQQENTQKALEVIEREARKQYELDKIAASGHTAIVLGTWEHKPETGYYYNAMQRWYYDPESKMYYGGNPPDWTENPAIPADARYEVMTQKANNMKNKQPIGGGGGGASGADVAGTSGRQTQQQQQYKPISAAGTSTATKVVAGMKAAPKHPMANLGGYQMPEVGRIGGAKGVGLVHQSGKTTSNAAAAGGDNAKRKRDGDGKNKEISKEEAEALARREAARQRVQARTMNNFGLS